MQIGEKMFRILPAPCAKMQMLTPACNVTVPNLHSYGLMTELLDIGDPGRNRTLSLLIRSQLLYPVELRGRKTVRKTVWKNLLLVKPLNFKANFCLDPTIRSQLLYPVELSDRTVAGMACNPPVWQGQIRG